jgi:hypothetical protein
MAQSKAAQESLDKAKEAEEAAASKAAESEPMDIDVAPGQMATEQAAAAALRQGEEELAASQAALDKAQERLDKAATAAAAAAAATAAKSAALLLLLQLLLQLLPYPLQLLSPLQLLLLLWLRL